MNTIHEPAVTKEPVAVQQKNKFGLFGLIAAIAGVVISLIPFVAFLGWILLIAGFILSIIGLLRKNEPKKLAIAGLIVSIVGTIISFIAFFVHLAALASLGHNHSADKPATEHSAPAQPGNPAQPSAPAQPAQPNKPADKNLGKTFKTPHPAGTVIKGREWIVTIDSVKLDVTSEILAANQFNKKPADGSQYALVTYTLEYVGSSNNGGMPLTVNLEMIDPSGVASKSAVGASLDNLNELNKKLSTNVYKGGKVQLSQTFEIPTATADKSVIGVASGFEDKQFIAVK